MPGIGVLKIEDYVFERSWQRNEDWIHPNSDHTVMIPFLKEKFPHCVPITSRLPSQEMTNWLWERFGSTCLIDDGDERYVSWSTGTWILIQERFGVFDYQFEHIHEAIEFKIRWAGTATP